MNTPVRKVLVVMAHPDDAEIGCGGTVAKWSQDGNDIRFLICTSGDKGTKDTTTSPHSIAEIREEEQRRSAEILGVKRVTFLRHKDGELKDIPGYRDEVALIIRESKPDIVVTHDPWRLYQLHPDHRECGFAVCDAVVAARDHLFLPACQEIGLDAHTPQEIYLTFPEKPDITVDITGFMDTKLSALSQHRSQTDRVPDWRARISKLNSLMAEKESFEYAEAFKVITITSREL